MVSMGTSFIICCAIVDPCSVESVLKMVQEQTAAVDKMGFAIFHCFSHCSFSWSLSRQSTEKWYKTSINATAHQPKLRQHCSLYAVLVGGFLCFVCALQLYHEDEIVLFLLYQCFKKRLNDACSLRFSGTCYS